MRDFLIEPLRISENVRSQIKAARDHCGYSTRFVARRMRCTHPSILSLENGSTPLTLDHLVRLAQIYGCLPHEFFMMGIINPASGMKAMERRTEFERHWSSLEAKWASGQEAAPWNGSTRGS